jgi:hypothetical protein
MITSTSISNRPKTLIRFAMPLLMGILTAAPAIGKEAVSSVKASVQAGFEKAVLGKGSGAHPATKRPTPSSFGMTCTPRLSTARPVLTITLPQSPAARRHVFAVISPSGRLYELYSPYADDVEIVDIIIPSNEISWQRARTRARFTLAAPKLLATAPGQQMPTRVFAEKGRYKFALVSAIQKDLIAVSDRPDQVTIYAGCLIDWMP